MRTENLPGQSQSPVGILARVSTRPYLKENEFTVLRRALFTGLRILVAVPVRSHP